MDNHITSIILVEDDEDDYLLTRDMLDEIERGRFDLQWVSTYESALEVLRQARADVFLVDYRLGTYNGLDLLREAMLQGVRAPIILLTGQGNREVDLEAMQAGAADYLVKGHIDSFLLERAIRYAIDRRLAEDEIRRNAARAEALVRTAARLNARLDLDGILNTVCEETAYALNAPASAVRLYNAQQDVLAYAAAFGLPIYYREYVRPSPRALYDDLIRRSGPVLVAPDVQALEKVPNAELYRRLNIRTVVTTMMMRESELIGGLTVFSFNHVREFSADELALLRGLADQAAQAIVNARLFAETRRRLEHVQALHTIDIAIASSFDLRLTFNVILDQATTQLGVDAAALLTLHEPTNTLEYAAGRGFRTAAAQHSRLQLGEGYAGRAAFERQPIYVPELDENPGEARRLQLFSGEGFVAYYGVPLIVKGRVKGVLEIFHRSPLAPDAEWKGFMDTLAGQAAIAIDNATMFNELQRSNVELVLAYDATIEGWSHALDLRDRETEGHTLRVTERTVDLALNLGLPKSEIVHIRRGALLHDIGKMGIPDHILLKPGSLTDEEWEIMRRHPTYAYEMLSPIAYLRRAIDIPYCHHEKWDGTGYPRGLKGEQIPLAARLFSIVDVWDALRSDRPYRRAWPEDQVRAYLRAASGTHFEPQVTERFLNLLDEK